MAQKLSIRDLDLNNKRVLIRVDFNVPQDATGTILDDTRIKASLPTINYAIQKGAKVILVTHFGRPKGKKQAEFSLKNISKRLSELLKRPVILANDTIGKEVEELVNTMKSGDVLLLENVRFYPAEEKPELDPSFAKELASLADVYVNDAFAAAHRDHTSTTEVAKLFPDRSAMGFLLENEVSFLGEALLHPKRPFYAICGGAKISTKLGVLNALIEHVDAIFLAGGMAYTFLKAQGIPIGNSICEENMLEEAKKIMGECKKKKVALHLPFDTVASTRFDNNAEFATFDLKKGIPEGYQGMDIGSKTIEKWKQELAQAKTILWNGPVGVFEMSNFSKGTFELAKFLANLKGCITICGGGETAQAVQTAGCSKGFTHVSTGGGACLEYIEQKTLPGIEALTDKK